MRKSTVSHDADQTTEYENIPHRTLTEDMDRGVKEIPLQFNNPQYTGSTQQQRLNDQLYEREISVSVSYRDRVIPSPSFPEANRNTKRSSVNQGKLSKLNTGQKYENIDNEWF